MVSGKAAAAYDHTMSEYNVNTGNSSTGQEWIIDAYQSLEPSVSLHNFVCNLCNYLMYLLMFPTANLLTA